MSLLAQCPRLRTFCGHCSGQRIRHHIAAAGGPEDHVEPFPMSPVPIFMPYTRLLLLYSQRRHLIVPMRPAWHAASHCHMRARTHFLWCLWVDIRSIISEGSVFEASGRTFSCSIIARDMSLWSAVRRGIACSSGLVGLCVGSASGTTRDGGTFTPTARHGRHS